MTTGMRSRSHKRGERLGVFSSGTVATDCTVSVGTSSVAGSASGSLVCSWFVCATASSAGAFCRAVVGVTSIGAESGTSRIVCDCIGAGASCAVEAEAGLVVATEAVKRVVVALVVVVVVAFAVVGAVVAVGFAAGDVGFVVSETVGT